MKDNIMWMLEGASQDAILGGQAWYPIVRRWCRVKAAEYEVRPVVVAALISALSPRNKWKRNLSDAEQVLCQYAEGIQHPFGISSGTFRKNVEKAWNVVTLDRPELVMTSPKTEAFVDNIINPASELVTVDVWARRIAKGDMTLQAKSIGVRKYAEYSSLYKEVADEIGMKACEVQAITWVEARNRSAKFKRSAFTQLRLL
ncbi:MAG: hypothetical protein KAJ73_09040 [Zetaproteobacteria bacterium]|nr:hypothetical protein [Zetaproteobacteria bacterium]